MSKHNQDFNLEVQRRNKTLLSKHAPNVCVALSEKIAEGAPRSWPGQEVESSVEPIDET